MCTGRAGRHALTMNATTNRAVKRTMNAVEMHDVSKSYGPKTVLAGLDLEIRAGEVFALLGPNGAGKTTAVEILEGYRRADGGIVRVLGFEPGKHDLRLRSRIGIVLQQTTSFEHSTVYESVAMFAALFQSPLSPMEAIELVDLGDQRDQVATTMSGGQRRRLDVACGIVGRPDVLFLDEPTTGLDPQARRSMWQIIADLRTQGTTVVLTTHYLDEAEFLADRIGVLLGGRVRDVAEPSRLGGRDSMPAVVRFASPPGEPVPRPADDVGVWERDGELLRCATSEPGRVIADLVGRIGEPRGLEIRRPSLEDVYLQMVSWYASGDTLSAEHTSHAGVA